MKLQMNIYMCIPIIILVSGTAKIMTVPRALYFNALNIYCNI